MFKGHILTVPGQILPFHSAVAHHHVFRVPKGVLGVEEAVFKHGILDVLERVLALKLHIAEVQIHPPHHKVLTLGGAVFHGHMAGVPAKFRGEDVTVFHHRIGALPQGLDAVELGVLNDNIIRIPQRRPAKFCHL